MKCHIQLNNARKTNKILDVFLKTYAYFATIFGSLKSLKGLPTYNVTIAQLYDYQVFINIKNGKVIITYIIKYNKYI